ncbi:MAG: histidine decarboxylase [Gemmatimonadota bacterium]|nr:MAG: histidine decarboxylase [Gemmatimonadota bacterium]
MSDNKNIEKSKGCADPDGNPNIPYGPEQKPWGELVPGGADITGPSEDPIDVYPRVPPPNLTEKFPEIHYRKFEIPPKGLTDGQRKDALKEFRDFAEEQHRWFTGYQTNQNQPYSLRLSWLLDMHTNNVGDPFQTGIFTLNTKFCERAVLDYFAALWNAPWPHHDDTITERYPDRYWGYVLSMGSTEANVYGLFNARDYLKGRALIEDPETEPLEKKFMYADPLSKPDNPNAYKPIVFYSQDTHYSVVKAVRILELTTFYQEGRMKYPGQCPITENGEWPKEVPSQDIDNGNSGTIDVSALKELVHFFVKRGYPPLIVLNFGSTWKGAYDEVPAVNTMLRDLRYEFPWVWERRVHYDPDRPKLYDVRRGFWLHVDGALGAGYMPFVEMAYNQGKIEWRGPIFDFRNEAVMSICTSMHKWFGAPWPGSVYLTRTGYQLRPPTTPSYIGAADTTLGGSRNAFSSVIFWDYLSRHSYQDSMHEVLECEEAASHLVSELKSLESDLKKKFGDEVDLWIARSKLSLAVRFRLVNPTIKYKFTVDSERLWVPISETEEQERTYSHVYVMQSLMAEKKRPVKDEKRKPEAVERYRIIDELMKSIRKACKDDWHHAFPEWDGDQPNPGRTKPITAPARAKDNVIMFVPHEGRGLGSFVHPSKRG